MSDVLNRVRAEITERLDVLRPAVEEAAELEAALAAFGGLSPSAPQLPKPAPPHSFASAKRGAARSRPAKRAPKGANRAAVLRAVDERPGASAAELAAASGVKGGVLYALLRGLVERDELVKQNLPSSSAGYSLPRGESGSNGRACGDAAGQVTS